MTQLSCCTQHRCQNTNTKFNLQKQQWTRLQAAFTSAHKSGTACCTQNSFSSACSRGNGCSFQGAIHGVAGVCALWRHLSNVHSASAVPTRTCGQSCHWRGCQSLHHTEGYHLVSQKRSLEITFVRDCRQCCHSAAVGKRGISGGILFQESETEKKIPLVFCSRPFSLLFYQRKHGLGEGKVTIWTYEKWKVITFETPNTLSLWRMYRYCLVYTCKWFKMLFPKLSYMIGF